MRRFRRITKVFLVWVLIVLSTKFFSTVAIDGDERLTRIQKDRPSLIKKIMDTLTLLKRSHKNSWIKIKSIINNVQLQYFPPNLDFRGNDELADGGGDAGAVSKIKETVQKSFKTTKVTVEESAKSAAKGVKAVHGKAEKVKESTSDEGKDGSKSEL